MWPHYSCDAVLLCKLVHQGSPPFTGDQMTSPYLLYLLDVVHSLLFVTPDKLPRNQLARCFQWYDSLSHSH